MASCFMVYEGLYLCQMQEVKDHNPETNYFVYLLFNHVLMFVI